MKTTHKQVLALLLAVALLLLLCACAQIQQLKGSDSATLPETLAGQASETQSEDPTQHSEITESQRAQHSEATEPQQAQYVGSEEGKTRCYGYGIRLISRRRCSGWHISAMSAGFLRRDLRQVFPRGFGKPMRPCCWSTPSSRRSMRSTSSAVQGICTASCLSTKTQQL